MAGNGSSSHDLDARITYFTEANFHTRRRLFGIRQADRRAHAAFDPVELVGSCPAHLQMGGGQ